MRKYEQKIWIAFLGGGLMAMAIIMPSLDLVIRFVIGLIGFALIVAALR